ncbi:hypothetical protein ACYOEI_03385 [Singulisphaera rosea]
MRIAWKMALTLILVTIIAFCGFGFLASFEPPGFPAVRWLYGSASVACTIGIFPIWRHYLRIL